MLRGSDSPNGDSLGTNAMISYLILIFLFDFLLLIHIFFKHLDKAQVCVLKNFSFMRLPCIVQQVVHCPRWDKREDALPRSPFMEGTAAQLWGEESAVSGVSSLRACLGRRVNQHLVRANSCVRSHSELVRGVLGSLSEPLGAHSCPFLITWYLDSL